MNVCFRQALSLRRRAALLLVLAVAAAFLLLETAQAQENSYVDLVMLYEYKASKVVYKVLNTGTATATEVTVSFLLEDLETTDLDNSRVVIDKRTDNTAKEQSFTWEVGTLLPGETSAIELTFDTSFHSGHSSAFLIGVINARASSISPEPVELQANNVIKVYSYPLTSAVPSRHMKSGRLALLLSVDDLRPDAGGYVDFDLDARNRNGAGDALITSISSQMPR